MVEPEHPQTIARWHAEVSARTSAKRRDRGGENPMNFQLNDVNGAKRAAGFVAMVPHIGNHAARQRFLLISCRFSLLA